VTRLYGYGEEPFTSGVRIVVPSTFTVSVTVPAPVTFSSMKPSEARVAGNPTCCSTIENAGTPSPGGSVSTKPPPKLSQPLPLNAAPLQEPVWQKVTLGPSFDNDPFEQSVPTQAVPSKPPS